MSGFDIRTLGDNRISATQAQMEAALPPPNPDFDAAENYEEALKEAEEEPADPDDLDKVRRKILKTMTTIVPDEHGWFAKEFAQLGTPVFKERLNWWGWTKTVFYCVAEGHIVRKWSSTDNYLTVDIHITAVAIPLRRWWDDNVGPDGTVPLDQAKSAWEELLRDARLRARMMGNAFLRLELKDHKEGPQQVMRLTGAGVCSHIRVAGPLTGDHGFFECHPDLLMPINPPKGPRSPGPSGPSAPWPSGPSTRRPTAPTTGGPLGPSAPTPTKPPRGPTTGGPGPWLPLYDLWL